MKDAVHKAGPVCSQIQYIEHKAGLVLCIRDGWYSWYTVVPDFTGSH